MPPKGLYAMARHHIYGGQVARRRLFNSNDFRSESAKPAKPAEADTTPQTDGANETKKQAEAEPVEKRKKKKNSLSKDMVEEPHTPGPIEAGKAAPFIAETKEERRARRKREKAEKAAKETQTPSAKKTHKEERKSDKKKAVANQIPDSTPRKKKRKRESEISTATPVVPRSTTANGSFVVGADLVENVKASLTGRVNPGVQALENPQTLAESAKKKAKSGPKRQEVQVEKPQKAHEPVHASKASVSEKPEAKKRKKSVNGIAQQQPGEIVSTPTQSYEPIHASKASVSEKAEAKKRKKSINDTAQQLPAQVLSTPRTPIKTPVPPPQLSQILVPETPPSKVARKAKPFATDPKLFSLSQPVGNTAAQTILSRKERNTVLVSTPTSAEDACTPKSVPPASTNGIRRPTVPNALTDANLNNHTQPSGKEIKVKQRAKSGVSTTTSLLESASSRSIMEAFARVGKPYARSGAEVDPFVSAEVMAKRRRETHEEASMNDFNNKFYELQKAVNFSEEQSYLEDYLAWNVETASNALPCLGNVTGCTTKKEEILRLSKEEDITILNHLDTEGGDLNALKKASDDIRLADEILMLNMRARVPVPIGRLEGTWTLYCPKYAETHFDRYGYGQRTLTISSIAGFRHENSYTARLNIPPRSMSYSILAFSTPPHASFRKTTVKTAAEGYTVDIVFLGNGYLQLRADLKLLLKGKASDENDGKKMHMEFIGVHEKALQWFEKKNELEEVAKKLFAKYDGSSED